MKRFNIVALQSTYQQQAAHLATSMNLQLQGSIAVVPQGEWYLAVDHRGLSLAQAGKSSASGVQSAFHDHASNARVSNSDLLLKALGFPKSRSVTIVDATAGLGSDAAVIARRAHKLLLIERSAIIAAVLREGLETHSGLADKLSLHVGDAITLLAELAQRQALDIVYLDPMFHFVSETNSKARPKKVALPKKSTQSLQAIVGADADQAQLLAAALAIASRRVVVKRPRTAAAIEGPAADYSVTGKQLRYDVYLCESFSG